MLLPPPRSTLFPYTTLFRSESKTEADVGAERLIRNILRRFRASFASWERIAAPGVDTDRKSTRLNSSHANISYAVFCLKKKKKTSNEQRYDTIVTNPRDKSD